MTTLITPDETAREENLVAHIATLKAARDEAAAAVVAATVEHETAAKAGDSSAAIEASKAMRRHRAELADAAADLADAEGWLADLHSVIAERQAAKDAADAQDKAAAAFAELDAVLTSVREAVEARVETLAALVADQRADYARLRAAMDSAANAEGVARALSGASPAAFDRIQRKLDNALQASVPLAFGWRVPPLGKGAPMLEALVAGARTERYELR